MNFPEIWLVTSSITDEAKGILYKHNCEIKHVNDAPVLLLVHITDVEFQQSIKGQLYKFSSGDTLLYLGGFIRIDWSHLWEEKEYKDFCEWADNVSL